MEFCVLFRKIGKNLSNKYIQKALDTAKKSKTDAIEIVSKKKKKIQKTSESTDDLLVHKIADKITSA